MNDKEYPATAETRALRRGMSVLLYASMALVAFAAVLAFSLNSLVVPTSPATLYAVRGAAVGGFVSTLVCCAYWRTVMIERFERDRRWFENRGFDRRRVESSYLKMAFGAGFLMLAAVISYG